MGSFRRSRRSSDGCPGSLVALAVGYGTGQPTWEDDGEELTAETSTKFFIFIVPCLSVRCSRGRGAQILPPREKPSLS